jgi:FlaA1/EpsC-like NDP-sugar epimerase
MVIDWLLVIFFSGAIRLLTREIYARKGHQFREDGTYQRVLIYGAGKGGELLLRSINEERRVGIKIYGFIDDDPEKKNHYIHNIKVLGNLSNINELVKKYGINQIFISIPSLSGSEIRRILKTIREQVRDPLEIKTIPGLFELVSDNISINDLRKFEIKDLLRRKTVHLDPTPVKNMISGRSVMVVGGGGSIGSELCRQIANFKPDRLIIIDNSEYNLYNINEQIEEHYQELDLKCLVADACKEKLMRKVIADFKPDLLFHAAAYKHVPLMEMNPCAAIDNNITSTLTLVQLSGELGINRLVFISTDKAVQPTSVMGATKRICEQIIYANNHKDSSNCLAVRFGNVLGSSGSVIPKFQAQIEVGGPITVTHPKITRYFMLISEAVELVLQAGAVGEKGKIYVLDMGEPVNIAELAKQLVNLSGLTLDKDIKIVYTGLRPGEKLHESLYLEGEEEATSIPHLLALTPKTAFNGDYINQVKNLLTRLYDLDYKSLQIELKTLVPEYRPITDFTPI